MSRALLQAISLVAIVSFPGLARAQDTLAQGKLTLSGSTATIQDIRDPTKSTSATVGDDLLAVLQGVDGKLVGLWVNNGKATGVNARNATSASIDILPGTDATHDDATGTIAAGATFKVLSQIDSGDEAPNPGLYYLIDDPTKGACVFAANADIEVLLSVSALIRVDATSGEVTLDSNVGGPMFPPGSPHAKRPLYIVGNEPFKTILAARKNGGAVMVQLRVLFDASTPAGSLNAKVVSLRGELMDSKSGKRPTSDLPLRDDDGRLMLDDQGNLVTVGALDTFAITGTKKIGHKKYFEVTTRDGHDGFVLQSFAAPAMVFFMEAAPAAPSTTGGLTGALPDKP
jgi:hypothetical protein